MWQRGWAPSSHGCWLRLGDAAFLAFAADAVLVSQARFFSRCSQGAKYVHTNLVAKDWRALAKFYCSVFNCVVVPPAATFRGLCLKPAQEFLDPRFGACTSGSQVTERMVQPWRFSLIRATCDASGSHSYAADGLNDLIAVAVFGYLSSDPPGPNSWAYGVERVVP